MPKWSSVKLIAIYLGAGNCFVWDSNLYDVI